jgi:hypothetical protein
VNEEGKLLIVRKKLLKRFRVPSPVRKSMSGDADRNQDLLNKLTPRTLAPNLETLISETNRKEREGSYKNSHKGQNSRSESPMVYDRYTPYYYNFVEPD